MQTDSKPYSFPFLLALSVHIVVLAFLIFELSLPVRSSSSSAASENIVHAVAISQQTLDNYEQAVSAQKQAQIAAQQALLRQQQQQAEAQRQAQLKAQQQLQQQLKAQQIQQQKLQQQKLQAAQQAAKEKAEQQAAAAAQQAAAAKAAQQAAQKAAAKVQAAKTAAASKAKQQAEAKKLQQALKQDMQNELNSDQNEINQNNAAIKQDQGIIDKYKSLIIQAISQQWIIPQNLPNNLACELAVRVAPGGNVIQVTVIKSSGNALLDNSAIAAVNKASPLPVPTDPSAFDQFRELHLTVKPDGTLTSS